MATVLTNQVRISRVHPSFFKKTRHRVGNRKPPSTCALISQNKIEPRRTQRCRDHQRTRIRGKSRIPGRIPREFFDKRDEEMSQVPLISNREVMASNSRDLVILEVGPPGDTWRYSVDRQRFAEKSEWFRAMLIGDLAPPASDPPPMLHLEHVDKRAFDHLLKYLRGESLNFQSVSTARSTLDVAHQLLCPELARHSVDYIIANLNASTVLGVYRGLNLFVQDRLLTSGERTPRTPTAPPAPGDDEGEIAAECSRLLLSCLTVIDGAPDDVLNQENFEELSDREVAELASRDNLRLYSEGILFSALDKWSAAECRRHGLEPTASNKRSALEDDVWYSVRYLLMTSSEFIEGPMHSGILSGEELSVISTRLLGHEHGQITNEQVQIASRLSSTPRNRSISSTDSSKSVMKPGKKEREDNKRNRRKECANKGQKACSRIGDCIIRVLACVFE